MKIKIYQIDSDRDADRVKFCGLQETQKIQRSQNQSALLNPGIYDEVFSGDVDCKTLEGVFTLFNTNHPPFHRGHSLSISDIVQITENNDNYLQGSFFCDRIGFEHINFDPKQTHKPDNLLRVVALEPGKPAYEAEVADELRSFQQAVRGKMEIAYPYEDNAVLVTNRDSWNNGMEPNRITRGKIYAGPMFIIGDNGDGTFCSLTDDQVSQYLAEYQSPELSGQPDAGEDQDSGMTMS